jgi:hypothetical protein
MTTLKTTLKLHRLGILRRNMQLAAHRMHVEGCPNCQAQQSARHMVSPLVGLLRSLGSAAEDEQEGSTGKTVQ